MPYSRIGTYTLTGKKIIITTDRGIRFISLKYVSGTVTYFGDDTLIASSGDNTVSVNSSAQTLDATGFEIQSQEPISMFTIDATLGEVIISTIR